MKKHLIPLIILPLFLSCSTDNSYLKIPASIQTSGNEITSTLVTNLHEFGITTPLKITKHGDLLAVERRYEENNLSLIDLSNRTTRDWLPFGKGENEAYTIDNLSVNEQGELSVFDFETGKLHRHNPKALSRSAAHPLVLAEGTNTHLSAIQGDGFVISTGLYEQGRYRFYSLDDGSESYAVPYPVHPAYPELSDYGKSILWASTVLRLRPDNKAFVCTDIRSGQLDICRINGNTISLVCRHTYYYPHVDINDGKYPDVAYYSDNVTGFREVAVSNERIYVLYSGKTYKEYGQKIINSSTLLVFDWNGTLLNNYTLPEAANYLAFDTEENLLYGTTPDAKLVQFNL
ncbi:BF3164 family lipoprotein [Butyricimonas sp.]|uniref:BF3164 family lipoprotein n=1 Tax=Butyricimonas sp. TaxID=1969738 RepID=UPI0025C07F72|nr:BF3164 family lipoprotein [Butyricimonas sp.]